jgi:hypothetical protein
MSLQDSIHTHAQKKALVQALRSTLTLSQVSELFSEFITDPVVKNTLDGVVGKKGSHTLNPRSIERIAATMMGFDSDHAMANHFNNIVRYHEHRFEYEHRHGNDSLSHFIQEGIFPSYADIVANANIDFEPHLESEFLDFKGHSPTSVTMPQIKAQNEEGNVLDLRHKVGTLCLRGLDSMVTADTLQKRVRNEGFFFFAELLEDAEAPRWDSGESCGDIEDYEWGCIDTDMHTTQQEVITLALKAMNHPDLEFNLTEKQWIVPGNKHRFSLKLNSNLYVVCDFENGFVALIEGGPLTALAVFGFNISDKDIRHSWLANLNAESLK